MTSEWLNTFSVYVILWWDIIDSHLFAIIRQSICIDWRISSHRKWHQSLWRGLNEKSPTVRWWTINSSKVTNIIRHEIIVLRSQTISLMSSFVIELISIHMKTFSYAWKIILMINSNRSRSWIFIRLFFKCLIGDFASSYDGDMYIL